MVRSFFAPLLLLVGMVFGLQSTQAQIFCNGSASCPAGATQVEITNQTICDYAIRVTYTDRTGGGIINCSVASGTQGVICYNSATTTIQAIEFIWPLGGYSAYMLNPGYPGINDAPVSNGGCGGNDIVLWDNFAPSGPGHITNILIHTI